jgi:hypothetical protein
MTAAMRLGTLPAIATLWQTRDELREPGIHHSEIHERGQQTDGSQDVTIQALQIHCAPRRAGCRECSSLFIAECPPQTTRFVEAVTLIYPKHLLQGRHSKGVKQRYFDFQAGLIYKVLSGVDRKKPIGVGTMAIIRLRPNLADKSFDWSRRRRRPMG